MQIQLLNGINWLNENVLRNYLAEFANRFLNYGPRSFPTSFNVLEPFFVLNPKYSILQLNAEEESYVLSLIDFLEFVTAKDFQLEEIDFFNNIPENLIYNFSFDSDFDEINFSSSKGKTFVVKSLSIVRRENEVSILMQAGQSFDKTEAREYFKDKTNKTISEQISPEKKMLGLEVDISLGQPKVVELEGREDLWLHSVALLIDIETKTIDIRFVARDENLSYNIFTDDFFALFAAEKHLSEKDIKSRFEFQLEKLSDFDAVFDFGKYCLALPFYIFENEDKLVDVVYETRLNELIKGPVSKRKFGSVLSKYKQFAKPLFYLESESHTILENKELTDSAIQINKSGYWKRLHEDEQGFDKKGNPTIGKTWVEQTETYFIHPKGISKIEQQQIFDNEEAGYVYIMRQPAHEENIFKVGLTTRTVDKRSKELSNTSTIDKFFVINKYQTRNCHLAEDLIHKKLENYRLSKRREFFQCDLKTILDVCQEVVEEINSNYLKQ